MGNEEYGYGGILALDLGSAARANKFMIKLLKL